MAGGSGTRFWPASRRAHPKQFLPLAGEAPLIRQTWDRAAALSDPDRIWVSAVSAQRAAIARALPDLRPDRFLGEPVPRNTAPALGLAALSLARVDPAAIMIATPADHVIARPAELARALAAGVEAARLEGCLVTLGIAPSRPETGYGWIETGEPFTDASHEAIRFVEKPDAGTAASFLFSGRFLWNGGIFVWRVDSILRAFRECAPGIAAALERIDRSLGTPAERQTIDEVFAALEPISIDHAVMEKAASVAVVATDPGWSDVGSWDAAAELAGGSAGSGPAGAPGSAPDRVLLLDASGCFVRVDPGSRRLIALVGVEDLIVVDTGDALLVCRKGASQKVRQVVTQLVERGRDDLL
jgi:mannose-1-phosphate guanylyltransferase